MARCRNCGDPLLGRFFRCDQCGNTICITCWVGTDCQSCGGMLRTTGSSASRDDDDTAYNDGEFSFKDVGRMLLVFGVIALILMVVCSG